MQTMKSQIPIIPSNRMLKAVQFFAFTAIFILFFSCEREIILNDPALKINGYGIEGHVYDHFGNPIPDVDVYLDYGTRFVDNGPEPSKVYTVTGSPENITVLVYTRSGSLYRTIGTYTGVTGLFSVEWDKIGPSSEPALPGVYSVRYYVGSSERLSYPVLVYNTRISRTDSNGRYSIADQYLPVDFYPIPEYSSNGTYLGNSQITNEVFLEFSSSQGSIPKTLLIVKDQLVQFNVGFN